MAADMKFKTTFACKEPLQGKKLKHAIDDYHDLTPGTTKQVCDKHPNDDSDDEGVFYDLDDRINDFIIVFFYL